MPDAGLRAFLLQSLVAGDAGLRWRLNLEAIERSMPALLAFDVDEHERFEGETLFLRGGASDYVREAHGERIRRHFPNAVVRSIEDFLKDAEGISLTPLRKKNLKRQFKPWEECLQRRIAKRLKRRTAS